MLFKIKKQLEFNYSAGWERDLLYVSVPLIHPTKKTIEIESGPEANF